MFKIIAVKSDLERVVEVAVDQAVTRILGSGSGNSLLPGGGSDPNMPPAFVSSPSRRPAMTILDKTLDPSAVTVHF